MIVDAIEKMIIGSNVMPPVKRIDIGMARVGIGKMNAPVYMHKYTGKIIVRYPFYLMIMGRDPNPFRLSGEDNRMIEFKSYVFKDGFATQVRRWHTFSVHEIERYEDVIVSQIEHKFMEECRMAYDHLKPDANVIDEKGNLIFEREENYIPYKITHHQEFHGKS